MGKTINKKENNAKPKKQQKHHSILTILTPIIVLIIVIYTIYKIIQLIESPTDMFLIANGTILKEENAIGYIIRDEKVAKISNNNEMIQIKTEGEKVAKGSQIFRYANANEDELNSKIDELNSKIQEALLRTK